MRTIAEIVQDLKDGKQHLSYSSLSAFLETPQKFIKYMNKQIEQTPAMLQGSAFHCLVLEPEKFEATYCVAPKVDRRTKAGKAEYELFESKNDGKTVLTSEQWTAIEAMKRALEFNPTAGFEIKQLQEKEIFDEIEFEGYRFKMFKDGVYRDDKLTTVTDLKTCQSANPDKFSRDFFKMNYWLQATIYAISEGYPEKKVEVKYIAVDSNQEVSVNKVHDSVLGWGYERLKQIIATLNYCILKNDFNKSYDFTGVKGQHIIEKPNWI